MQFLFELLKINFCQIQQVNSEITPPLHPRFINKRQNMPYQQVNGEKKPIYNFFELLKMNFFSIQQVNNKITPPLLSRLINTRQNIPYQQVNKQKNLYTFFLVSENEFFLNSTSQQQNHTTPSPKTYRYKTDYTISTSQQRKNPFLQCF